MRRMYSENQVKEIVKELLAITNGMGVVRVMDAPASTTLTDEQIELIRGGTFIKGLFLGELNPILVPPYDSGSTYIGGIISGGSLAVYIIDKTTKVITIAEETIGLMSLKSIYSINSTVLPSFPNADGKTYTLKFVNGVLTCVEDGV